MRQLLYFNMYKTQDYNKMTNLFGIKIKKKKWIPNSIMF